MSDHTDNNSNINRYSGNDLGSNLSDMAKYLEGMAGQLGFFSTQVGNVNARVDGIEVKVDEYHTDHEDRIRVLEEDEGLKPYMINAVNTAVHIRVASLLEIEFDKRGRVAEGYEHDYTHYYGKFRGKLHNDAKREGIEASEWKFTPRRNYNKLIDFISDWVPACGVEGLKRYYDRLETARLGR